MLLIFSDEIKLELSYTEFLGELMTYEEEMAANIGLIIDSVLPDLSTDVRSNLAQAIMEQLIRDRARSMRTELESMKYSLKSLQDMLPKLKQVLDPIWYANARNHIQNLIISRLNTMEELCLEPLDWEWDDSIPRPFD